MTRITTFWFYILTARCFVQPKISTSILNWISLCLSMCGCPTGLWVRSGVGYIKKDGSYMTCSFVASHLGYWLAAFPTVGGELCFALYNGIHYNNIKYTMTHYLVFSNNI